MKPIRIVWASEREAHVISSGVPPALCCGALLAAGIEGVAGIASGSRTVQIRVGDDIDPEEVMARVRSVVGRLIDEPFGRSERAVVIPICSDPDLALDLQAVARGAGLSPDAAADLHASGDYTVCFLGFSPGFPYIDGLPEPLHTPRLDTPRARVRAGSVGIAGARTGIYPQANPGGWRLVGATPLRLFDPTRGSPALLAPGDRIRFRRIERDEFDALERESV